MILPLLLLTATPAAPTTAPPPMRLDAAPSAEPARRIRLALQSTSAVGVTHARFFNQLVGLRLDYRFGQRFAFGGALAYANLKGKDGRVHNVLPELSSEYRAALGPSVSLPLRLSLGFLPKNGPTFRFAAGLSVPLSERLELELLPIEPMIWTSRDRPEVSFNASVGLSASF